LPIADCRLSIEEAMWEHRWQSTIENRQSAQGHFQMRRRSLAIVSVGLALALCLCRAEDTYQEEADRLAVLLNWQPSSTVADIGAGEGQMTLAAAKRVGRVYATELDAKMLAQLEQIAAKEKNVIWV
jgi:2-polyprenyl-3-methyl-5-hydroxy-6-metoxy-1,4-benzoquinol methylase